MKGDITSMLKKIINYLKNHNSKTYKCDYPDPDNCSYFDHETKNCTADSNVKCSYRIKHEKNQ